MKSRWSPAERARVEADRQLVLEFIEGEGLSPLAAAVKMRKPPQYVASLYCRAKLAAARAGQEVAS